MIYTGGLVYFVHQNFHVAWHLWLQCTPHMDYSVVLCVSHWNLSLLLDNSDKNSRKVHFFTLNRRFSDPKALPCYLASKCINIMCISQSYIDIYAYLCEISGLLKIVWSPLNNFLWRIGPSTQKYTQVHKSHRCSRHATCTQLDSADLFNYF